MQVKLIGFVGEDVAWRMNVADVQSTVGRRECTFDMVMAVMHVLKMWSGMRVEDGKIVVDCGEFWRYLSVFGNRVIDRRACRDLKKLLDVDVTPDRRKATYVIPRELKKNRRLRHARRQAAQLNYHRRMARYELLEARREAAQERAAKRKQREEEEEEEAARKRSRWDSDEEFGVEVPPDYYEDTVSFRYLYVLQSMMGLNVYMYRSIVL